MMNRSGHEVTRFLESRRNFRHSGGMQNKEREILDAFFRQSQAFIDAEIAKVRADPQVHFTKPVKRNIGAFSTEGEVQELHRRLMMAHAAAVHPNFGEDNRLFIAAHPIEQLADRALNVAYGTGRLGEISAELDRIRAEHGLTEDEYWPLDEGPAEYVTLEKEWDRLSEELQRRVMWGAFTLYRFDEYADLLREDLMTFKVRKEVGRRISLPQNGRADGEEFNRGQEDHLLNEYGQKAYDLLCRRLRAVGLEPAG